VALFPGNTGDGTITWYSDQGNTEISTNDTLTFLLDQDTTIYARRIACDQSPLVSISLAFTPLPLAPERIEGPSETLCAGATVTLTVIDDGATATDTFQWLTTPTGPVIATGTSFTIDAVAAGSTTYFVRKKDVCDNLSPTINYEVEALAIPSVGALQIPDGLCLDLAGDFQSPSLRQLPVIPGILEKMPPSPLDQAQALLPFHLINQGLKPSQLISMSEDVSADQLIQ